eukprot:6806403-Lingulodinium_polyedra.AAC.1
MKVQNCLPDTARGSSRPAGGLQRGSRSLRGRVVRKNITRAITITSVAIAATTTIATIAITMLA